VARGDFYVRVIHNFNVPLVFDFVNKNGKGSSHNLKKITFFFP
jgi:hypothetical protein